MIQDKPQLKLIKPGVDIKSLLAMPGDFTYFGGVSELRYFVDYLGAIPINDSSEIVPGDILLINNSSDILSAQRLKSLSNRKIQLVSDLNLRFSEAELGEHISLTQIPHNSEGEYYSSMESAVVLYDKITVDHKQYTLVYGGLKRDGNRDEQYLHYLDPQHEYVSALFTNAQIFPPSEKIKPKVPRVELQSIYSQTKYGLVISDPRYYDTGMVTQRYWEYCLNNMVAFVDSRYDMYGQLVSIDDFRRVLDKDELEKKIAFLDTHIAAREGILTHQRERVARQKEFMEFSNANYLKKIIYT